MKSAWALAKDNIRNLKPCAHGGTIWGISNEKELTQNEILDFSSSVNPLGSSSKVLKAITSNLSQVSIYPDSTSRQLRKSIANRFKGVTLNNVVVGNGSTELIYLFAETFLNKNEVAVIPVPTFGEYENAVKKTGGKPKHIQLGQDFCVHANTFIQEMRGAKIVFFCNPNNPTSVLAPRDVLIEIIETALYEDVIVFLDEDFLEFVDEQKRFSLVDDIERYPNLFVLQSFTKIFGLAGLRVGYGIASEEIIKLLSNAKIPWSVNCLAQVAASVALTDKEHLQKSCEVIRVERLYLTNELSKIEGFRHYNADANFILINIKDTSLTAKQLKDKMLKKGILIRDCSSFRGLDDYHIRVAIKTRQENKRLVDAFKETVEKDL